MENNIFRYNYSAEKNKEVENIRRKYLVHEESKLQTLKRLDRRVQMAGTIEGLCLGITGALVFGVGICLMLKVLTGATWLMIALMILGTLLMIPAYPIYRAISRKTREGLTPEILRLSEEILKS